MTGPMVDALDEQVEILDDKLGASTPDIVEVATAVAELWGKHRAAWRALIDGEHSELNLVMSELACDQDPYAIGDGPEPSFSHAFRQDPKWADRCRCGWKQKFHDGLAE